MALVTREGSLVAIGFTILPLFILWALIKLLPPWSSERSAQVAAGD
jgi:hypothetical protein